MKNHNLNVPHMTRQEAEEVIKAFDKALNQFYCCVYLNCDFKADGIIKKRTAAA